MLRPNKLLLRIAMHIAAVGWSYVVLMMAITEETVVAGIMTLFLYGVLPVTIILYITGSGGRRRRREQKRLQEIQKQQQDEAADSDPESHS